MLYLCYFTSCQDFIKHFFSQQSHAFVFWVQNFWVPILYSHLSSYFEGHNYSSILSTKIIIIYTKSSLYALEGKEQKLKHQIPI